MHILQNQLRDTVKAHLLTADGTYEKVDRRGKETFHSQDAFCKEATDKAAGSKNAENNRVFIPETHHE